MFAPLIAKAKADSGRPKTSVSERTLGKPPMLVRKLGPAADMTGLRPTSSPSWDFARIPLSRPDQPCPLLRAKAAARDEGSPEEHESESPCGDCRRPADQAATNDCTASDRTASQGKSCGCAKCTSDESGTAVPMQATPPAHTYTLVPPRGSYGDTAANITPPTCTATAAGGASMTAGSAAPTIRVFANGTYQVDRNDGVRQTATCTRLPAGLTATRTHEESHATGARNAVTAANTAAGTAFATMGACTAALATWNTSVNAAWNNEVTHGPGTNPPTAATFVEEHAAGGCTFA
jgi:hypothetical protein